jgi:hypothetical protein
MSFTICLAPAQTIEYSQGGGHLWVYLNWALALRAAGCRIIWLEGVDLSERAHARRQRHGTKVHHSARFHAVNPCLEVAPLRLRLLQSEPHVRLAGVAQDSSSSRLFASFRSAVPNPSVNQS